MADAAKFLVIFQGDHPSHLGKTMCNYLQLTHFVRGKYGDKVIYNICINIPSPCYVHSESSSLYIMPTTIIVYNI